MVLAASFLTSLLLVVAGKPLQRPAMVVHETRIEPPRGFVHSGAAPVTTELTLRIALKSNNIAGLETALYAVSDPASPLYGQHLTADEVAEFVKPTNGTLSVVGDWLSANGISSKPITPAGDTLQIVIPVAQANELLSTEFAVFTHVDSSETSIRTLAYSIPATLQGHIEFLHPTTSFLRPMASRPKFIAIKAQSEVEARSGGKSGGGGTTPPTSGGSPSSSCNTAITPACLQALYGIPSTVATQTTATTPSKNNFAVTAFTNEWANLLDLKQFLTSFRPDMNSSTTFITQTMDNGINIQTPRAVAGLEANLDTQYAVGLAMPGVTVTLLSIGNDGGDGMFGFMDSITQLIQEPASTRPSVLSTSYGFDEDAFSLPVASNLCNAYMQLGALGTSILFSSGDGGVSGSQGRTCTDFVPTMPSNCPFVTSVGSTGGTTETASTFSSGGFSNYFGVPSYQAADVSKYISGLGSTYSGLFNRAGRGFPDVAAQGENFEIVLNAVVGRVDGTSCSTPTFASIIALLNEQLIAAGKPVLGFLNPFLYSAAGRAGFKDITTGDNPGCNTNGFSAKAGWDPVTGLGTPNFAALKTAVGL
ncbi:family S53 protease [Mycena capillaripes]|nr:family S53 protease [Mycena capillaripes]